MANKATKSVAAIAFAAFSMPAFAGGYLTNTNQSIAFLRNPSQDAMIGISALYNNPANTVFLEPGFHLGLNIMNVHQNRNVTTTYAPFAFGKNNGGAITKTFEGKANAPILPSLQFAYNTKDSKWSFSFDFGIIGGGGKCEYDNGLPSFESAIAALSMLATMQGKGMLQNGYDFNTYMRGRSYQYGFQLGAARKVLNNLSVYGGLRLIYATNNYFGYVQDIQFRTVLDTYIPSKGMPDIPESIGLNCNQAGWGLTPVIGVDWKVNEHWNLAAKFEFKTKIRLKNESINENTEGYGLEKYDDGKKVAEDIPSILTVGAQYSPISTVRINAGYHYYWDKQATKFGNENKLLNGGTWEITAGAEWDFAKGWTVSAGWQTTNYPNTDEYMRDISFVTNSNTFGFGVKWQINKTVAVEAAYFQTIYNTYERTVTDYNGLGAKAVEKLGFTLPAGVTAPQALAAQQIIPNAEYLSGTDKFDRTNRVVGIGATFDF